MHSDPPDAPYHAHLYYEPSTREKAEDIRDLLSALVGATILYVGPLRDGPLGPHPQSQFEIHFPQSSLAGLVPILESCGLRALVHPLTLDDTADHTTLATWIGGKPLPLDLSWMDPPGINQGIARFGKSDF